MKINKQKYNGFRIFLEKGLTSYEEEISISFINNFVNKVHQNNGFWKSYTRGGWQSYLSRNNFGILLQDVENKNTKLNLTFRRISNHKREFAIHKIQHLTSKDGKEINLNQCICPLHLAGEKVIWKDINNKPEFFIIYEEGII